MKSPVLISLSPNTEDEDVQLAASILRGKKSAAGSADKLKEQLAENFPNSQIELTSSGRAAITHLLKTVGIGGSDHVIVQAFTCLAVPAAVKAAGATPVFADVDDTFNLTAKTVEEKITTHTKAIIVQHSFGIPADLSDLRELANRYNMLLIEDLAHGFDGNKLGLVGDAAILSFGRDKIISSVFGGAIVMNNPRFKEPLHNSLEKLKPAPRKWVHQQLRHPVLMSFIKPWYFRGGKFLLILAQKLSWLSMAVTAEEKTGKPPLFLDWKMPDELAALALLQIKKMERFNARRREIVSQYNQSLGKNIPALLRYPVLVQNPQQLLEQARKQKMFLGDWYQSAVFPCAGQCKQISSYNEGSCPQAEKIASQVINLPTYPTMTDEQVQEVIDFIKPYVR